VRDVHQRAILLQGSDRIMKARARMFEEKTILLFITQEGHTEQYSVVCTTAISSLAVEQYIFLQSMTQSSSSGRAITRRMSRDATGELTAA
jgi:hypothetical protein